MTHPGKPFKVFRLNDFEGGKEMLTVETIRKIKLARGRDGKTIRQIVKDFNLSRNTVRKVLGSEATRFEYHPTVQPMPRMDRFTEWIARQWSARIFLLNPA
ncbi:hypothetical protein H4684_002924 [Desulfomicrobium macestii]|uniref:HTH IS21-type domain-containing protein n=1 Tax=Desulfomicrobium macestii TaxID=90731 RepID=A0ABR9H6F2_9BACT|nr:hypothetical protein [Desulfomicrobium macestii]MBE1426260.1 hypothetical protein [Desulfomicrobium macestii]